MTYRIITLWKLNKVTVEKISVCDSEVGAWVTCKISIRLRESPDHKQLKKSPMLNQNEGIWQLVAKTIVVRKSLGQQCPCEFESHPRYKL